MSKPGGGNKRRSDNPFSGGKVPKGNQSGPSTGSKPGHAKGGSDAKAPTTARKTSSGGRGK